VWRAQALVGHKERVVVYEMCFEIALTGPVLAAKLVRMLELVKHLVDA